MVAARSLTQMGCPRVAAFLGRYLYSPQALDRMISVE
jgi:hypothetical protein